MLKLIIFLLFPTLCITFNKRPPSGLCKSSLLVSLGALGLRPHLNTVQNETLIEGISPDISPFLEVRSILFYYLLIHDFRIHPKMFFRLFSSISTNDRKLKCLSRRADVGLRPPPGGPMAQMKFTSTRRRKSPKNGYTLPLTKVAETITEAWQQIQLLHKQLTYNNWLIINTLLFMMWILIKTSNDNFNTLLI